MTHVWTNAARRATGLTACLALAAGLCLTHTAAEAGGADEIKYRQAVMKSIGGHFGAVKSIVTGRVAHTGDLKGHARALLDLAKTSQHIFPENSGPDAGETGAKPRIWEKWADFQKVNQGFITEAENLVKAADAGDLEKALDAFGSMGKNSCGGCHKPFRTKLKK